MTNNVKSLVALAAIAFSGLTILGGPVKPSDSAYRVLAPTTQDNLTVFPIVMDSVRDTHNFLTLDEGLRSGQVRVTEEGASRGLVRPRQPRATSPDVWSERPPGASRDAQVNRLVLINNSERPLILLAGEIVTGGKQDRIVGKDRIVPPKSDPIDLGVFCVEPHRWVETSSSFGGFNFSMVQPSVRQKAMAAKDQQAVWNEVAKSRASVAGALPPPARQAIAGTSSYAMTMSNAGVRNLVDRTAAPLERSYDKLLGQLRARQAVGAVVAVNGQILWADVFASTSLLEKYWPKLVRSYAAEAVSSRASSGKPGVAPLSKDAQTFIDDFQARREDVEIEPGVYRNTEMLGRGFDAFILTSLLPGINFDVHIAKMSQ